MIRVNASRAVKKAINDGISDNTSSFSEDEELKVGEGVETIKEALRKEARVDKLEQYLNGQTEWTDGKVIRHRDNLEVLINVISKPHEVDSRTHWQPLTEEECENHLVTREMHRKPFVDVNKQMGLKNIY